MASLTLVNEAAIHSRLLPERLHLMKPLSTFLTCCLLTISIPCAAEVRLPHVFGSHMVLQRGQEVPVWGWADAGEGVTVTFREHSVETKAGADGKWMVKLPALAVGEPGTLTVKGGNEVKFDDVLVGEVWVCSGQSNMQWSVNSAIDPDLELAAAASNPQLRLFRVPLVSSADPQEDVNAEWTLSTPETVPGFSAVGYFYGRQLQETLGIPVGMIQTSWGGTRAEAWTTAEGMKSHADLEPILTSWDERVAKFDPAAEEAKHKEALAKWEAQAAAAKEKGQRAPNKPAAPENPRNDRHRPTNLYNAMVAPLVPYAIRGAIWYQGESNAGRAYQYRTLMPAMITSWRKVWGQGDFPFYIVQLANFKAIADQPGESDWAELREAQSMTVDAIPNVGVACITDIGAAKDIHPKNKEDVAKRLARLALVDNYGYSGKVIKQGPTYKSLDIQGANASFTSRTAGRR
ncbi:MAG: sialate O-acetylesterase [Planctomycetaceae bacterium]